jgi:uncharacterized protein YyaL (SSP411 family)
MIMSVARFSTALLLAAFITAQGGAFAGPLANRLAGAASPYLSGHAGDPVPWQPLDARAWALARELERPLLIAVGYLSCHWCRTMHRETYLDPAVGGLLGTAFVPVLVDRELQPQVDRRLGDFLQDTLGYSGWPMHVVVTPDGHPLTGFTYQPRESVLGLLDRFAARWQRERSRLEQLAARADAVYWSRQATAQAALSDVSLQDLLAALLQQAMGAADPEHGGFGVSAKYPSAPRLAALLDLYELRPDAALAAFLGRTLDAMLQRGLHDQVGGGFFRYTADAAWGEPHFEKMLYANALLAEVLLRAADLLDRPDYREAALATLRFMLRELHHPRGGFAAALAASDGAGQEGAYYLWREEELVAALGGTGAALPADRLAPGLHPGRILPAVAEPDIGVQLLRTRERRQRPERDDKRLVAWNGLALRAFAAAYSHLDRPAREAVDDLARILAELATEQGALPATLSGRQRGGLADHAYAASGLLAWQQRTGGDYGSAVRRLLEAARERFHDDTGWVTGEPSPLLAGGVRKRALPDDELPSPSAVWLKTALQLGRGGEDTRLREQALRIGMDWPVAMLENAFFHATHIAGLVQAVARQQRESGLPHVPSAG